MRDIALVVDFDVKNNVDGVAGWKTLNGGRAPTTFYAATPSGGWHRYYRDPAGRYRNSASQAAPGVDVRGVGGFVVAPGSPGYTWNAEAPLTLEEIPELPDGIIPTAAEAASATGPHSTGTLSTLATSPPSPRQRR